VPHSAPLVSSGLVSSGSPLIGVLALQGDVREHVRALHAAGARATSVRRPDELESVDGLIIPGGESTTLWRLATSFDMLEPLRKMLSAGLPAFGSCAGMIMLADRLVDGVAGQQTFGGIDMTVRRNAFGRQVDSFESDITLNSMAGRRGSSRRAMRSRSSAPTSAPVGSSRSGRVPSWPRRSIRS
jgi:pyridoxal 5'-phosphate synthase glutaminase subunit Pdx2